MRGPRNKDPEILTFSHLFEGNSFEDTSGVFQSNREDKIGFKILKVLSDAPVKTRQLLDLPLP